MKVPKPKPLPKPKLTKQKSSSSDPSEYLILEHDRLDLEQIKNTKFYNFDYI